MFHCCCRGAQGVFKPEFRKQVLATVTVTIITFCHGIGLGWVAPMLLKLQTPERTPLAFTINVDELSWVGGMVNIGGMVGNLLYGTTLDCIGRKAALYLLAVPHLCLWALLYFAQSVEVLYAARFCGGLTGGGVYVVLPLFIGEISDPSIRGRLTSMFSLTLSSGILVGIVFSAHLPYHSIPIIVAGLPLMYLLLAFYLPETPQHLMRRGREQAAEESLKFYRNYQPNSKAHVQQFNEQFAELKSAIQQQKLASSAGLGDYFNKRAMKSISMVFILLSLNAYSGSFALMNYMSNIFAELKTEVHPDTNTIIIGVVQLLGIYVSTLLIDRFGRKLLMTVSAGGMGLALGALGIYAFLAEETQLDLSQVNWWLPLVLMATIIFMANVGINSVTFILAVELLPAQIRAKVTAICLTILSGLLFLLLKGFPLFMDTFGLYSAMWFCACVCALGLFYMCVFLHETKGQSVDKLENVD